MYQCITVFFFDLILSHPKSSGSPEAVIRRFEQRNHAIDSKGVAEYLRALVVTNALAEYLPDESSGKPSSLPTLVFLTSFSSIYFFTRVYA